MAIRPSNFSSALKAKAPKAATPARLGRVERPKQQPPLGLLSMLG